jgi:thiol-disulfide isomerase/thioredoxin
MSSPGLDESLVLSAFTDAYNDKFRELMRAASDPTPMIASPSCSACQSAPPLTIIEVPKELILGQQQMMGQQAVAMMQQAAPPQGMTMMQKAAVVPQKEGGGGSFWMTLGIIVLVLLLIFFACQLRKSWTQTRLMGSHLSVEGNMNGKVVQSHVKDITDPAQAIPTEGGPTVVMFHATWCGHCKTMRPLFDSCAVEFAGKVKFAAVENTVLEKSGKSSQLNIQGYPTVMAFDKGQKIGELVGNVGAQKLKEFVKNLKT